MCCTQERTQQTFNARVGRRVGVLTTSTCLHTPQGPPSSELCHRAFRFNQAFLVLQYMMLCLAVGLFATALFTILYSPRDYLDVRLEVRACMVPCSQCFASLLIRSKERIHGSRGRVGE